MLIQLIFFKQIIFFLSIKKLTRLIGMSRTDLHRKLNAATGMSATEFIRFMRLKKAASLMITHAELKISHIALEAGFYNLSYFIKSFRNIYGVTPHVFRKRVLQPETGGLQFSYQISLQQISFSVLQTQNTIAYLQSPAAGLSGLKITILGSLQNLSPIPQPTINQEQPPHQNQIKISAYSKILCG